MGTTASAERRDPSAPRRPLRTTVDIMSGDERDAWQADAIDASVRGMSMRASVLPEVGETLGMKLKPDASSSIAARAEVVWAADKGTHAGTFGVRFTELSPAAEQSLQRMLDGGRRDEAPRVAPPPADARVKLFIQGMDAPLRARVRRSDEGEVVVGSDLSFLKLGDKVDVDGAGSKVNGTIVKVDVEVDAKTRVPRLVLSIDLGGRKRPTDIATAETMLAESPRASDPELPAVKPVAVREHARPVKTAALAEPVVAAAARYGWWIGGLGIVVGYAITH